MLRKTADYKLQEVEGLKINLWILISQKMSHQQAERFDELSSTLDTDLIQLLLNCLLYFNNRNESLLWVRQLQLVEFVFVSL